MKLIGGFFVWEADGWFSTVSADDICEHAFRNDLKEPVANIYIRGTAVEDVRILKGQEAEDFHRLWMNRLEEKERADALIRAAQKERAEGHPREGAS